MHFGKTFKSGGDPVYLRVTPVTLGWVNLKGRKRAPNGSEKQSKIRTITTFTTITGAWNSDDATWSFADGGRVEEDGG